MYEVHSLGKTLCSFYKTPVDNLYNMVIVLKYCFIPPRSAALTAAPRPDIFFFSKYTFRELDIIIWAINYNFHLTEALYGTSLTANKSEIRSNKYFLCLMMWAEHENNFFFHWALVTSGEFNLPVFHGPNVAYTYNLGFCESYLNRGSHGLAIHSRIQLLNCD